MVIYDVEVDNYEAIVVHLHALRDFGPLALEYGDLHILSIVKL